MQHITQLTYLAVWIFQSTVPSYFFPKYSLFCWTMKMPLQGKHGELTKSPQSWSIPNGNKMPQTCKSIDHTILCLWLHEANVMTIVKCTSASYRYVGKGYSSIHMLTSSKGNICRVTGLFVRGIHRSEVNSAHKEQGRRGHDRGALMFSLIYAWTNSWAIKGYAGDLWHHRAHYDVTAYSDVIKRTMAYQIIINLKNRNML